MILTEEHLNSARNSIFIEPESIGIDREYRKGVVVLRDGQIDLSTVFPEIAIINIYYNEPER